MPVFCNDCKEVTPHKGLMKNAVCSCGSKDLKAVAGKFNDNGNWDYYDRKGELVISVSRGTMQPEPPKK